MFLPLDTEPRVVFTRPFPFCFSPWLLLSLQALVAAHVADLSYYDPDGVHTESSFGALKDRAVLGNEQHVVGFFSCSKTDSHCLLMYAHTHRPSSSRRPNCPNCILHIALSLSAMLSHRYSYDAGMKHGARSCAKAVQ